MKPSEYRRFYSDLTELRKRFMIFLSVPRVIWLYKLVNIVHEFVDYFKLITYEYRIIVWLLFTCRISLLLSISCANSYSFFFCLTYVHAHRLHYCYYPDIKLRFSRHSICYLFFFFSHICLISAFPLIQELIFWEGYK